MSVGRIFVTFQRQDTISHFVGRCSKKKTKKNVAWLKKKTHRLTSVASALVPFSTFELARVTPDFVCRSLVRGCTASGSVANE